MPIYDYSCNDCDERFEFWIRKDETPICPSCGSENLERLLSLPSVKSETTKNLSMRAAKKRDAVQARDRMHERLHLEHSHDRHG